MSDSIRYAPTVVESHGHPKYTGREPPLNDKWDRILLLTTFATDSDAAAIASLRNSVSRHLTREFGKGHWSGEVTTRGVLRGFQSSRVLVARDGADVVATLRLTTRKPWAIDLTYFTAVAKRRALYLVDMAVEPKRQRQGMGRRLLESAREIARAWPAVAIRLDAYDAAAGAGSFYARCGFQEMGRVTYRGHSAGVLRTAAQ